MAGALSLRTPGRSFLREKPAGRGCFSGSDSLSGEPLRIGQDAPFPWFGGKRRVAPIVWDALGDVPGYIVAFAGSRAVLPRRPHWAKVEARGILSFVKW